jgi:hypothetical protein
VLPPWTHRFFVLLGTTAAVAFFLAYRRAWRAGLRRSDCLLRDPRLVMLYLGLLAAAGASWTVWTLWGLWQRLMA